MEFMSLKNPLMILKYTLLPLMQTLNKLKDIYLNFPL